MMFFYTQTLLVPGSVTKVENVSLRKMMNQKLDSLQKYLFNGYIFIMTAFSVTPALGFAFIYFRPGRRPLVDLMEEVANELWFRIQ